MMWRRPYGGAHEYYDAMTTSDEPWKWASFGSGIGGLIGGVALCFLNPIAGLAVIGIGFVSSIVCGIVAHVKHKNELNHYIMEDRKRVADHCDVKDKTLESNVELNQAEVKKINAETKAIENSNASYSKETINSSMSTSISK